jgi:predicted nucleotidyltransferase
MLGLVRVEGECGRGRCGLPLVNMGYPNAWTPGGVTFVSERSIMKGMELNRDMLISLLQQHREEVRRYGVRSLGLFGSHSRGTARAGSDIDLLVEFDKKSFDAYMDLKFFLEDLLHAPVDLVLAENVKPRLRDAILQETVRVPGL